MENIEQARDIRGRFRTDDEPFGVGGNADHCRSFKRPRVSENIRDSRLPNLNNTSRAGISFKSQPCCDFRTRGCSYGTNCRYSHEFRGIDQGELVAKEIGLGYNNVCKWYTSGKPCPYGNRCRFPHEDVKNGVDEFRKSHAISIAGYNQGLSLKQDNRLGGSGFGAKQDNTPVDVSLRANQAHQRHMSWKTRLCNRWETVKECPYGSKCFFAHGLAELLPGPSARNKNQSLRSVAGIAKDEKNGVAQVEGKEECSIRWKTVNKLVGIYADWIEDMPSQPDM
ncbi:hypothetical protein DCAR_0729296 [Daucus carota subsp. sativus]|uniref:C3H1-type domain-containing protein n=1 Tax=Daucus carota subsp. sativus TaxID=79200 RepID=A0A161ZPS2_DAUCS|nr:PREDICTED: zinc finger CCCH domain-containing protein 39-like [Daucus carota subsp. sativus]WOH09837.1 hypothetical protein DCAR_0729296 [Daucus carota subsp. sativus]